LKVILSLPLTSLSINHAWFIYREFTDTRIAIIKETITDIVRENIHLKNVTCHYDYSSLWLRNLDLHTPDEDDKKLLEEYLSDFLNFHKWYKSSEIEAKIKQNAKHRVEGVRYYED
jgi:hypothetical protein